MIKTFVGLPGAGKSLYFSYLIGTEIRRIKKGKSKYDQVAINFDWDDGEGNFARYCYKQEDCTCVDRFKTLPPFLVASAIPVTMAEYEKNRALPDFQRHWEYGGLIIAFEDLPDLYEEVNTLVFVDEAGYLLNAMDWNYMDDGYKGFLLHHRKNITDVNTKRFDMYIATQHKDIVEITLRRISNNIYWIRPLFLHKNPDKPPKWLFPVVLIYYYKQHEIRNMSPMPEVDINGNMKPLKEDDQLEILKLIHVYWIGKRYRNYYNTLQKVNKVKRIKNK